LTQEKNAMQRGEHSRKKECVRVKSDSTWMEEEKEGGKIKTLRSKR
jgi:hypothetical protein